MYGVWADFTFLRRKGRRFLGTHDRGAWQDEANSNYVISLVVPPDADSQSEIHIIIIYDDVTID